MGELRHSNYASMNVRCVETFHVNGDDKLHSKACCLEGTAILCLYGVESEDRPILDLLHFSDVGGGPSIRPDAQHSLL